MLTDSVHWMKEQQSHYYVTMEEISFRIKHPDFKNIIYTVNSKCHCLHIICISVHHHLYVRVKWDKSTSPRYLEFKFIGLAALHGCSFVLMCMQSLTQLRINFAICWYNRAIAAANQSPHHTTITVTPYRTGWVRMNGPKTLLNPLYSLGFSTMLNTN